MIRDAHTCDAAYRAMAQVTMVFAIAPAIAPVIDGWLQENWGWRSNFYFLALFALALIAMQSTTRETLAQHRRQSFQPLAVMCIYLEMVLHRYRALCRCY